MHREHPEGKAGSQCRCARQCGGYHDVEGELVATIGENRKMLIFPLDQVPEMGRGRGVRLQRYKDGGLCDRQDLQGGRRAVVGGYCGARLFRRTSRN